MGSQPAPIGTPPLLVFRIRNQLDSSISTGFPIRCRTTLDEGEVTLSYPAELSAESFKDLEDRLQIILRGAKRRVIAAKPDDEAAN